MKKILSLGVASAVLALTAVAASAETAEKGVKAELASGTVATGETLVYNIVTIGDGVEDAQCKIETEGLEYVGASATTGGLAGAMVNDGILVVTTDVTKTFPAGTVIATVEYKVTAAEGEAVKFALAADPDYANFTVDNAAVTDQAAGAATSGDPTGSDNSDENSGDTSGDNQGTNPPTGIALAVVPAVIAGAAVVVAAKKRK